MKDSQEFKQNISTFLKQDVQEEPSWKRWLIQNTREKALALLIAIILWIVFVLHAAQGIRI